MPEQPKPDPQPQPTPDPKKPATEAEIAAAIEMARRLKDKHEPT